MVAGLREVEVAALAAGEAEKAEKAKIALFCNVQSEAVIECLDSDSIYKIPAMLHEQMLDEIICHKLNILAKAADLSLWKNLVYSLEHPECTVNVAFVGKYVDLTESYKSLTEALTHAGLYTRSKVKIHYIDSEEIESKGCSSLKSMDAILVPGGFGSRGVEGKIATARFARKVQVVNLDQKKLSHSIPVGRSPHGVSFISHAPRL